MRLLFSSLQWMIFIITTSVVAPIVIGNSFGLPQAEIATLLQRTLFVLGLSGLLQAVLGHRLPIMEGPAGLWWGVFIVYASIVEAGNLGTYEGLQQLEMGMILSGVLFILLAIFKLINHLKKLFTPIVTGTYLLLLVAQLSGSFMNGIFGVGYKQDSVDFSVAIPAVCVLIITILLAKSRVPFLRRYSVLLSLLIGSLLFAVLRLGKSIPPTTNGISVPQIFAWGMPQFNSGMIITSIMIGLLLLTNMLASIYVVEKELQEHTKNYEAVNYNKASFVMGIIQWLSGIFSAIGSVPISGSAGFIAMTKIINRLPFILGNVFIILLSFIPMFTTYAAMIPEPVGYAILFYPFTIMIGLALKDYQSTQLGDREYFIIGFSLLVGIGLLFIPGQAINELPSMLRPIINNGLVVGTVICITLDQVIKKQTSVSY
ncbi:purine/pyrimidine permease [Cytobacillus sp. Hm23]